jgi:hypothetical protein
MGVKKTQHHALEVYISLKDEMVNPSVEGDETTIQAREVGRFCLYIISIQ